MSRPKTCRRVACQPLASHFKPQGIPLRELDVVTLSLDELEALRLIDFGALSHEEAARSLGVSRATAGRIVEQARHRVTDALLHGKALRIEGGAVRPVRAGGRGVCPHCRRRWGCGADSHRPAGPIIFGITRDPRTHPQRGLLTMRIAIASDNGDTIAGHAGRCACFAIFESQPDGSLSKTVIPNRHTAHAQGDCHGHEAGDHAHSHHSHSTLLALLQGCDAFISRGMGPRLRDDLFRVGIQAIVCDEIDARRAAERWAQGTLQSAGAGQCNHG